MPSDDIARLYDFTGGTTIQSSQVDGEFNQLITTINSKFGRGIANTLTGNNTFSGDNTFSGTNTFSHASTPIKTDKVVEYTSAAGVTIDSVLLKDGYVVLPAGAGFTPSTNGQLGYDSTSNTYDVYVNGAAKSLLHTGSSVDDLNDVTVSAASSGQVLAYNGSAWVNAAGGITLLDTQSVSGAAAVNFTTGIGSTYDEYEIRFYNIAPATDGVNWLLRVSEDSGSTYKSGASDYEYANEGVTSSAANADDYAQNATSIKLNGSDTAGNATNEVGKGIIRFSSPAGTSQQKFFTYEFGYKNTSGVLIRVGGSGIYKGTTNAINAIRILASSGNMTGTFKLYGIKSS